MTDHVSISDGTLTAEISATGAELVRLQDGAGRDLLWDGDPTFWTGRSPLLFPIVGEAKGNRITVAGTHYEIGRHGFARTSRFALVASEVARCTWRLEASEATRRQYPFAFRLDVGPLATPLVTGATVPAPGVASPAQAPTLTGMRVLVRWADARILWFPSGPALAAALWQAARGP